MKLVSVKPSSDPDKKLDVVIEQDNGRTKTIRIGSKGNSDFILSGGDEQKKKAYLARHSVNEDWSKSGVLTAGFWSRWLLWNKPSLQQSISDVKNRFNL
jgi:hypothetical protein